MSTKYICINYDVVDNIKKYLLWIFLHKAKFVINLLFSEIFSIFNYRQKLRTCAIIFKHINKLINKLIN